MLSQVFLRENSCSCLHFFSVCLLIKLWCRNMEWNARKIFTLIKKHPHSLGVACVPYENTLNWVNKLESNFFSLFSLQLMRVSSFVRIKKTVSNTQQNCKSFCGKEGGKLHVRVLFKYYELKAVISALPFTIAVHTSHIHPFMTRFPLICIHFLLVQWVKMSISLSFLPSTIQRF